MDIDHDVTMALSLAALNHGIRMCIDSYQTENQLVKILGRSLMSTILFVMKPS